MLKDLFSGCRVNFLLGAGFSANLLGILDNNEVIFEALRNYRTSTKEEDDKLTILISCMYWNFFERCIYPIATRASVYSKDFEVYKQFGSNLYRIFSERSNPSLDCQFNIFTTNYDPIIEMIFDHSHCICNDGFEGRIEPKFATDNYTKSYYRQAIFSNRKSEIPSLNLIKLHGSVTWALDIIWGGLTYQKYDETIKLFHKKYKNIFDTALISAIQKHFTAVNPIEAAEQISSFIKDTLLNGLVLEIKKYKDMFAEYKSTFLIVNPTKEKFSDTLLNKNYYELARIFSNELEKENTLLIVQGFSFKDEHILDLTKRSMLNPSLKIIIFCYEENEIAEYENMLSDAKNRNISYICLDKKQLSLEQFNQILSCIHV